jgi:hypothetical protein
MAHYRVPSTKDCLSAGKLVEPAEGMRRLLRVIGRGDFDAVGPVEA